MLTAYSDRAGIWVWEYKDHSWELNLLQSKPESARRRAYQEWALLAFESNRWVVKRQYPRPMPKPKL